jgi:hypothetical protein
MEEGMRKIAMWNLVSADGYFAAPDGGFDRADEPNAIRDAFVETETAETDFTAMQKSVKARSSAIRRIRLTSERGRNGHRPSPV